LDRSQRREVSREITQKNAEYSDNARGMQITQINKIIRLVCIEEHMGLNTGASREQGVSGRNRFRDWGQAQVWGSKGSTGFRRRRWSVREHSACEQPQIRT